MKKRTIKDTAAELGIHRTTLHAWIKEGADINDMEALQERADAALARTSTTQQIAEARLRKLNAEAEAKEHALEVENGRWILADDARKHAGNAALHVKAQLEMLEDALPPILEGHTALQMKAKLRDYSRSMMQDLSECFVIGNLD